VLLNIASPYSRILRRAISTFGRKQRQLDDDASIACPGALRFHRRIAMAQIKIFGLRRCTEPVRSILSDAIHGAVIEALAYPPEKRFHRFILLDDADFVYPSDRSERYLIIEVSLFEGRSVEVKKRLIRQLYERVASAAGIAPQDIEITIFETPRHAWGIRGLPGDEIGLNYKVEL
jgi:phenylpyruvate tautomerase PptA (4-oxalocrotonate tautomerase family)